MLTSPTFAVGGASNLLGFLCLGVIASRGSAYFFSSLTFRINPLFVMPPRTTGASQFAEQPGGSSRSAAIVVAYDEVLSTHPAGSF